MNERTWKKLPDDLREILRVAMKVSAYDMYIQSYHESGVNWATMKSEYPDIQVKTFPQPVLNAMKKANDELLTEEAAKDPLAKEIIDSQAAYMKTARVWSNISDRAYLESVDRLDQ